jgi:DNA-binding response OmpR family regulator
VSIIGEAAMAIAEEHNPKIVLLNAMMDGMPGLEVCRSIRNNLKYKVMKTIS